MPSDRRRATVTCVTVRAGARVVAVDRLTVVGDCDGDAVTAVVTGPAGALTAVVVVGSPAPAAVVVVAFAAPLELPPPPPHAVTSAMAASTAPTRSIRPLQRRSTLIAPPRRRPVSAAGPPCAYSTVRTG